MSGIITESEVYSPSVASIEDGDDASGIILTAPLEQLANRTKYIKGQLDGGSLKLREAADIPALKAVTGQAIGDIRLVPGVGPFRFDPASTATADDLFVVTPTTGGGRWLRFDHGLRQSDLGGLATITGLTVGDLVCVPGYGVYRYTASSPSLARTYWRVAATAMSGLFEHVNYGMIDAAGGFSGAATRLDPSIAPVPNRLVSVSTGIVGSGSGTANTTTGSNIASVSSVVVEEGDFVVISGQCAELEASAQDLNVRILEGTTLIGTIAYVRAGERHPVSFRLIRTIPGGGSGTFQYALNVLSNSANSTQTHASINLNVEVVRP